MVKNISGITTYLESLVAEELAPCISVAMAYKGETVLTAHAAKKDDPMYANYSADIRHNIGSVSKIVTGALITKLMETGRISVHDNIQKHLPAYPFKDNTVMQLLCHSTGADSFCCQIPRPNYGEPNNMYEGICAGIERTYEPGTASCYFSWGYTLLMEIIERISGKDFETYAREQLLDPLGMDVSTFDTRKLTRDTAVMPYFRATDTYEDLWNLRPTGDSGLFTTVGDLLKFAGALQDAYHGRPNAVFNPWQAQFMFRECSEGKFMRAPAMWRKGDRDRYNFFSDYCSPQACGHTGYSGCMLMMDPTYEISIAIITNSNYLHDDWNNYRIISNRLMGALQI